MNNVNKTLYIPLYGKAYVSRKGILIHDPKAEQIWDAEGFSLKGKAKSKWLAYYMGMRSAVFDHWLEEKLDAQSDAVVLHLGCGMDSRAVRLASFGRQWFDVDFPQVIRERERYYLAADHYHMIASDLRDLQWLEQLPKGGSAIVVMEGVSMYLQPQELKTILQGLRARFDRISLLMDCYTEFAARVSKYKNPINTVGVTQVYGMDDPRTLEDGTGIAFLQEQDLTPENLICQLQGMEQRIFRKVYAGSLSRRLYRLYEFCSRG